MSRPVITNIQTLRFVAAGAVLLTHCADLLVPHRSLFFRLPWNGGVDLFFVISGFIMTWLTTGCFGRPRVAGRFLLQRAVRIAPPYWFFTTLMIGAGLFASSQIKKTTFGAAQIITSYAFIPWPRPADGKLNPLLSQGWTLNYEVFFYAAFAAALFFRHGLWWLVLAFVALAALHPWVPSAWFLLSFYTDPIILEFVAGIGVAQLYGQGIRLPMAGSLALVGFAALVFVAGGYLPSGAEFRFFRLGLSAALVFAAFGLRIESASQGPVKRLLRLGGAASYTLYLSHTFTAHAVALVWRRYGGGSPWWGVGVAVVTAIGVALLLYRFVERPATQLLGRVLHPRRPSESRAAA